MSCVTAAPSGRARLGSGAWAPAADGHSNGKINSGQAASPLFTALPDGYPQFVTGLPLVSLAYVAQREGLLPTHGRLGLGMPLLGQLGVRLQAKFASSIGAPNAFHSEVHAVFRTFYIPAQRFVQALLDTDAILISIGDRIEGIAITPFCSLLV